MSFAARQERKFSVSDSFKQTYKVQVIRQLIRYSNSKHVANGERPRSRKWCNNILHATQDFQFFLKERADRSDYGQEKVCVNFPLASEIYARRSFPWLRKGRALLASLPTRRLWTSLQLVRIGGANWQISDWACYWWKVLSTIAVRCEWAIFTFFAQSLRNGNI